MDWAPAPNFASFVEHSDAAVTGRVVEVSPARWNTANGLPGKAFHDRFRDVKVTIEQVLYASPDLPVQPGQVLNVRLFGDGTETGKVVHGADPIRYYNRISGPVDVGAHVLWVLESHDFSFFDDMHQPVGPPERVAKLLTDFYGAWTVDAAADQARSLAPGRSVPYGALVAKLEAERANPSGSASGSRGRHNPLEG